MDALMKGLTILQLHHSSFPSNLNFYEGINIYSSKATLTTNFESFLLIPLDGGHEWKVKSSQLRPPSSGIEKYILSNQQSTE